jgi:bifunctional DNA-binding transcriptional regulator/antitoxin component of YhaV-PrlF toxin-antitoxin module
MLPARLRAKYGLDDGDNLTVIDLGGSILLTPEVPVVSERAAEIERLRRAAGLNIADLTSGRVARQKRRASRKRS